ncbi:uncharacterized protein LOC115212067 isoform X2, partial [Argonauta hians]
MAKRIGNLPIMIPWKISLIVTILLLFCCGTSSKKADWSCNISNIKDKTRGPCSVEPLQQLTPCIPGHTETIPLFQIAQLGIWNAEDNSLVRQVNTTHFEKCYDSSESVPMKLHMYVDDRWKSPEIKSNLDIMRIKIEDPATTIVNDYLGFDAFPTHENIQLPRGMFCKNMTFRNMSFPEIPTVFTAHYEQIFLKTITTQKIIFDLEKKYVFYEVESQNVSHGSNIFVYDYITGHKYSIVKATGKCLSVENIRYGDLFVKMSSSKLEMTDALSFFHLSKSSVEYIGMRQVRSVICDVWAGTQLEEDSNTEITVEWYFTQKNWTDEIGRTKEKSVLFRMDVWQPGNPEAKVYNFYQFDTAPPPWSVFDITPCVIYSNKIHFTIQFAVRNNNSSKMLSHLTEYSPKQKLQVEIAALSQITPVRLADIETDVDLTRMKFFFSASLLNPPEDMNKKFQTDVKSNTVAYAMINGYMKSSYNTTINMEIKGQRVSVNLTAENIWKSSADRIFSTTTVSTTGSTLTTRQKTTKLHLRSTVSTKKTTIRPTSTIQTTTRPTSTIQTTTSTPKITTTIPKTTTNSRKTPTTTLPKTKPSTKTTKITTKSSTGFSTIRK